MRVASRALRQTELALWYVGIALVGVALGATYDRWNYQVQQQQALSSPVALQRPAGLLPAGPDGTNRTYGTNGTDRTDETKRAAGPISPMGPISPISPINPANPTLDPLAVGRIEIPRLGLNAVIRAGADEKTLARAVGLVPGAARPGESGNVVLAAHRDTFFRPLRKIRVNDRIRVVLPRETYEYRVEELRVVSPEETDVLQSKGMEELTLVTCYPFRFIGPAPDRFIVSASRVN
jgi:sortase A